MTRSRKCLRQDIREHDGSLAVLQLDFAALDFVTDVVIIDVDMFRTAMVDGVLRHLDAGLVVLAGMRLDERVEWSEGSLHLEREDDLNWRWFIGK